MAKDKLTCPNNCPDQPFRWFQAMKVWDNGLKCRCGEKLRWTGIWPAPKSLPNREPEEYEVVGVIRIPNSAGFALDWYHPVCLICESPQSGIVLWPRYWINPEGKPKFGQDGPHLKQEYLDYLNTEVKKFISRRSLATSR